MRAFSRLFIILSLLLLLFIIYRLTIYHHALEREKSRDVASEFSSLGRRRGVGGGEAACF